MSAGFCQNGKTIYESKSEASKARAFARFTRGRKYSHSGELQAFRCDKCSGWHLGHTMKGKS